MKKLINKVDDVEREMIEGLAKAAPKKLRKLDEGNIIVRTPKKEGKVALVSGGGSGHEPAHGGYVGSGMLDCAVAGSVFTSPTPDQIYEGIKAVATDAGVLAIVKNYTGDVLNFEMAIDMAKDEGVNADYVIVNDDVAVKDSLYTTGRRGVAGTIFVHKIAGARAEEGASLAEVKACAESVIKNVRSMGMAIAPCTVPAPESTDSRSQKTKSRSASASMASRARAARRCSRPTKRRRDSLIPFLPTSTTPARRSSSSSTAWVQPP